jgi:D-alanyl-D-alanine carboxypeptidase
MRRGLLAALACVLFAVVLAAAGPASPPPFVARVARLSAAQQARMTGVSWHRGCPVSLRDLRALTVSYWDFGGARRTGRLIVNRSAVSALREVFRRLYVARFPIRRMVPVDAYGGSDFASIEADNTSAFNCRRATGSTSWSEHAYGRAIDVNPIENPYVDGGRVAHAASRTYVRRSPYRQGMAIEGGAVVEAFRAVGWGWGGSWGGTVQDFQHFSASGR